LNQMNPDFGNPRFTEISNRSGRAKRFILDSRGLVFVRSMEDHDGWLFDDRETDEFFAGTSVVMSISLDAKQTAKEIYERFENDEDPAGFTLTHAPRGLLSTSRTAGFTIASQKVLARFENFSEVMLDFEGVPKIGQAFADEILRVFANMHPEVKIVPIRTSSDVERMIRHVLMAPQRNMLKQYLS